MALYGKNDQHSDAPKFIVRTDTGETGQAQYGNTVMGASADEVGVDGGIAHTGWVKRTVGTGGRSGREHFEVLVAGHIEGDAVDYSDNTAIADASGAADDSILEDS